MIRNEYMKNKITSIENASQEFLQKVFEKTLAIFSCELKTIEIYIAHSDTFSQDNSFLNAKVYGYKNKEILNFLKSESVFFYMEEIEANYVVDLGKTRWETAHRLLNEFVDSKEKIEKRNLRINQKSNIQKADKFFELSKGLFKIKFNRVTAEDWLKKRGIKIQTANLVQKDYVYENQELKLTLANGTTKSFDLSKSPVFRPVFESFFNLFNAGTDIFFDKNELLTEYKRITRKRIDWQKFIHIKSSYRNMIKDDPILKKRIIWQYVKSENKYQFQILPLS